MFRVRSKVQIQAEKLFIEAYANSNDTKPVELEGKGLAEGSACMESDTGDLYMFSEADQTWHKFSGGAPTQKLDKETWTFTLEDDTTVEKEVAVWISAE